MHPIRIETNAYWIDLVCHDLVITQLAVGDPRTGDLNPPAAPLISDRAAPARSA